MKTTSLTAPLSLASWLMLSALMGLLLFPAPAGALPGLDDWCSVLDERLVDYYSDPAAIPAPTLPAADTVIGAWSPAARDIVRAAVQSNGQAAGDPFPFAAGRLRARVQQAAIVEMAGAVRAGRVEDAKALRAALNLPRGVSATEGALLLQALGSDPREEKRSDAARLLAREAITWQTTRVRQLLDEATRSAARADAPMPGRLMERLGEALNLADLPTPLRQAAGIENLPSLSSEIPQHLASLRETEWTAIGRPLALLRKEIEERLPSLLTPQERNRRERLLLKLVEIIPREYSAGVRDGQITVPLEYREAITFTQQARQIVGELAPLWLADRERTLGPSIDQLEEKLNQADGQIASKSAANVVESTLDEAASLLKNEFGVSLRRSGSTVGIVEIVMLETRSLLSQSLAAAIAGDWPEAQRLRLEAYTTYDPELEARLLPRDPQLALDIEHLLLDGLTEPGVKVLLDRHASAAELEPAYARVSAALDRAAALLKSGISPTAAAINAGSIVLREGLEGLLVIVAIFAGLRGAENAGRRRLFWLGIFASLVATAGTWILSQTLLTRLHAYGEIIEAVTGMLAIGILLLITNWLFHQVYWRQWVTTLKAQAVDGERGWQLVMAGFLVGYREGFETVLFLQSLVLDAGGQMVGLGVAVGLVILLLLGMAALWAGMKLPYFKILLVTAVMIGVVLITFVGGTVRAAQTVGWLPVHRLTPGSWPAWLGQWLGMYNTWESVGGQLLTTLVVLGTWRIARYQAKRKTARRRQALPQVSPVAADRCAAAHDGVVPISGCDPTTCELADAEAPQHAPATMPSEKIYVTAERTPTRRDSLILGDEALPEAR